MVTRSQIIAEAKEWYYTPWQHHTSKKRVCCDCIGLFLGVANNLGIPAGISENYHRIPRNDSMRIEMDKFFEPIRVDEATIADLFLFQIQSVARHVGIITHVNPCLFIHTHQTKGVKETRLGGIWQRRITQAYRVPGLED